MKLFIKNSYLFLILFLLLLAKNYWRESIYVNPVITYEEINKSGIITANAVFLYQNPYLYNKEIYIKTAQAINNMDYVVVNESLLGVIKKHNQKYAIVKLMKSNELVMQVKINNCYGILENGIIKNVSNLCNININDRVYTSDLAYINKTYFIGTISKIMKDNNNINNQYQIDYPNLNFANLNIIRRGD